MSEATPHISDNAHADAFIHDILGEAEAARVRSHCETCPACKQLVEDARKRLALLQALPPTEAPPQLIAATMKHLDDTIRRRARVKKWTLAGVFGVSAAAVLLLTALHWHTQHLHASPYDLVVLGQHDLLAGTSASLRVRLVDRSTNRPVASVPVTVTLIDPKSRLSKQLDRFTTDAQGSGEPKYDLPDYDGDYELHVRAETPDGEEIVLRPIRVRRSWKVMVSTDKPVYQPGQTIHVRTLALRSLDQKPAKQLPAVMTLIDPKGNILFKQEGTTSQFGIAAVDCKLADEIGEGAYTLACKIGNTESRRLVEVKKYVLPKFKVEVKLDRPYYHPGEKAKVTVQADYFFGKPVENAAVVVEVRPADSKNHEEKLHTDAKGHAEFEYTMPTTARQQVSLVVDAQVTDASGQKQAQTVERTITQYTVRIDVVPENGTLVQGVPNTVYVLTTRVDGLPMALRVKVADFDEIRTDALGVGSFVVTPSSNIQEIELDKRIGEIKREIDSEEHEAEGLERLAVLISDPNNEKRPQMLQDAQRHRAQADKLKVQLKTLQEQMDANPDLRSHKDLTFASTNVKWNVKARDDGGALLASDTVELSCGVSSGDFLLRSDKAVYRSSDTIQLSVRAANDQPVYVDVLKDGQTLLTRTIDVKLGIGTASVDLSPEICGTLQLCAYRFDKESVSLRRSRVVYVHPAGQLHIETTLDRDEYRPRGAAKINFRVTDGKGGAAPGVLSIAAVDEAVFSVLRQSPGREAHFYTVDDGLLAPAYRLRPWLPEAQPKPDDESRQRLQQALFAATSSIHSADSYRRSMDFDERSETATYSMRGESFSAKEEHFEINRAQQLTHLRYGAWAVFIIIALLWYACLWLFIELKKSLITNVVILLLAIPVAFWYGYSYDVAHGRYPTGSMVEIFESSFSMRDDLSNTDRGASRQQAGTASIFRMEVPGEFDAPRVRDYFPETLAWQPQLVTDDDGRASLDLELADSITTWRLSASAVTADGRLGATEKPLKVFQPFFVDVNLPATLTRGDELAVPVVVYNYLDKPQTVALSLAKSPWFTLLDDAERSVELAPGQVRSLAYRLRVEKAGEHELSVTARAGGVGDAVKRKIEVVPDGRRIEVVHNGTLDADAVHTLALPKDAIDGSGRAFVKIYPSGFSEIVEGLDGVFRLPSGCFEQTSSSTYPNVLALDYLQRTKQSAPAVEKKAKGYIHAGYQRLLTFEAKDGGFGWFGGREGDVRLTAYGLMEFTDMARVHDVDPNLLKRTREWLLKKRGDDGAWLPPGLGHDETEQLRLTAYVAWAVFADGAAADQRDRTRKYLLQQPPQRFDDAYLLALVRNALLALDSSGKDAAVYVDRLEALKHTEKNVQQATWSPGKNGRTLYYGYGDAGTVETTALAALALLKDGRHPLATRQALSWLAAHKDAHGTWGSTQATVLSLKALLSGASSSIGGDKERRFEVRLGDEFVRGLVVSASQAEVLQIVDLSKYLTAEPQRLTIRETTGTKSAYQVEFRYHEPLTRLAAEDRPLRIEMKFAAESAKVGETITATATATNRTGKPAPMVMLELPVPVGFTLAGDDFEKLVEKNTIAKFERTPRGVLVYLTELRDELKLTYQLRATTPARGTTTPARVYEYYNPHQEGRSGQWVLVVKEK